MAVFYFCQHHRASKHAYDYSSKREQFPFSEAYHDTDVTTGYTHSFLSRPLAPQPRAMSFYTLHLRASTRSVMGCGAL